MSQVDIDALLAEAGDEAHTIKFATREWQLPPRLPLLVLSHLEHGRLTPALEALFGADEAGELMEAGMSHDALSLVLEHVYSAGETSASTPSVRRTGKR